MKTLIIKVKNLNEIEKDESILWAMNLQSTSNCNYCKRRLAKFTALKNMKEHVWNLCPSCDEKYVSEEIHIGDEDEYAEDNRIMENLYFKELKKLYKEKGHTIESDEDLFKATVEGTGCEFQ